MWMILFAAALLLMTICILAVRLRRYRMQIRHICRELDMLDREDTNYRLSSYCLVGETEEVIYRFNELMESYRSELLRLRAENRTYRESITSISHDIRTPLTSARGYLQMLAREPLPEHKRQTYIASAGQRVDDVTDLLNQLFEYARVEAGEMEFVMERINLANLFTDTLTMFYNDFSERGCEPAVDASPVPVYIEGDRHALVRMLENLIKNALVHGTGDYRFALARQGDRAVLSCANRTDSIERRDIDRLFDRFYTTDASRTRASTGLGLAIVKKFADQMGGQVRADLQGDVFPLEVEFPLCE